MTLCQSNAHITDSRFFRHGYATDESKRIFCDLRRMQRWLDVEVALAKCQASLGIIPKEAASDIIQAATLELFDLDQIQAEILTTGHSLIPLLTAWQHQAPNDSGQFIHFGVTTQDIQDTAQSLEIKEVLELIEYDLAKIIEAMATQAQTYRDLTMVGRTHGQPALPTTLGLKITGWLDEALRNYERIQTCKKRVLVSQLFGGVGTMSALSDQAMKLLHDFSLEIGLAPPLTNWHNSRDRLAEYLSTLALVCGGLARAANEIYELAKNEIGELAEPFTEGQIGSSTMPHKINPETCEQVVVLARLVKNCAASGFDALVNEHERDYRAVRLEWVSVTEASLFTCSALQMMHKIISGLVVQQKHIENNLAKSAHLVSTEAVMFALGKQVGKQRAHTLIYQAAIVSSATGKPLLDTLADDPQIQQLYSRQQLQKLIAPERQTGQAGAMTDTIISLAKQKVLPLRKLKPTKCPLASLCSNR